MYIWGVELAAPRIIPFPAAPPTAATRVTGGIQPVASASWIGPSRSGIQTASTADPLLLFSNSKTASTISVYDPTAPIPDGSEQITNKTALAGGPIKSLLPAPAITGLGPEDAFDEGYSMDLSPVRTGELTGVGRLSTHFEDSGEAEDDTFGFKKGVPAVGKAKQQEGMSILDDSEFF